MSSYPNRNPDNSYSRVTMTGGVHTWTPAELEAAWFQPDDAFGRWQNAITNEMSMGFPDKVNGDPETNYERAFAVQNGWSDPASFDYSSLTMQERGVIGYGTWNDDVGEADVLGELERIFIRAGRSASDLSAALQAQRVASDHGLTNDMDLRQYVADVSARADIYDISGLPDTGAWSSGAWQARKAAAEANSGIGGELMTIATLAAIGAGMYGIGSMLAAPAVAAETVATSTFAAELPLAESVSFVGPATGTVQAAGVQASGAVTAAAAGAGSPTIIGISTGAGAILDISTGLPLPPIGSTPALPALPNVPPGAQSAIQKLLAAGASTGLIGSGGKSTAARPLGYGIADDAPIVDNGTMIAGLLLLAMFAKRNS